MSGPEVSTGLLPADVAMSLAHAAGVARSTATTNLRRLEAAGLVSVEPDPAGGLRIVPLGGSS